MSRSDIMKILIDNNIGVSMMVLDIYEKLLKENKTQDEIFNEIERLEDYYENNNNRYSNEIMEYLRLREGLDKYDTILDEQFNEYEPNKVFYEVCGWRMGGCDDTIKHWIKDIYNIDLDSIH